MKKHILSLFLIFITSLIISSCRKEANITNEPLSQAEMKFFKIDVQFDSAVKKVIDTIYAQNQAGRFVDKLAGEIGFPLWDKSEVIHSTSLIKNMQVIVPFALPSQKEINSFLVCNIYDKDINIQLVKGASYAAYGFNSEPRSLNAGRIAQILMYFDHKVFGDSLFFVNDPGIVNISGNVANRTSLATPPKVIKITPQPVAPTPIYMIPQQCPNGVNVKYTTVDQQSADPFGQDPCTIWITTSSVPQFPSTVPPGGGGGGSGGASSGSQWSAKPTCIKVEGGKVYFDVPGCTAIPPITALTGGDISIMTGANQTTADEKEDGLADNDPDLIWWDENTNVPNFNYSRQDKPAYQTIYNNYPKNSEGTDDLPLADVCKLVGGIILEEYNLGRLKNACAIRVSRTLNYSGVTIPEIMGQTGKGSDGKNYFFKAEKLYNWLTKTLGTPDIHLTSLDGGMDGSKYMEKLIGSQNKGIYIMKPKSVKSFGATGHATLWNGLNCIGGHNYFGAASDVYIWKLP